MTETVNYHAALNLPRTQGDPYTVDLVRASAAADGIPREQRLTVGAYASLMEAEEHLHDAEYAFAEGGVSAWGEDGEQLSEQPYTPLAYITAVYPPDGDMDEDHQAQVIALGATGVQSVTLGEGDLPQMVAQVEAVDALMAEEGIDAGLAEILPEGAFDQVPETVMHIDGGGTAHWFGITEDEERGHELRYFRALESDDRQAHHDSHLVMPLPDDDPGSAWPLPALEMYLEKGDVYMAQQLAHDVADAYGQDFPAPSDLPALDPQPEYYFGYGVGPNDNPALEEAEYSSTFGRIPPPWLLPYRTK